MLEIYDWYIPYLTNVSLVLQAFGLKELNKDRIECFYRHLGVEENCSALAKASKERACYTYPIINDNPKINCGFMKLCNDLNLA